MIAVWRIGYCPIPAPLPAALLSQQAYGSSLGNGRWHTAGPLHQVVYCGGSRSLCQLEKRVHANGATLKDQALMRLEIPDGAQLEDAQTLGLLPADWRSSEASTQAMGNAWLAQRTALGLWVPSYVEPHDQNLLLNPAHPDFIRIQLVIERHPFQFDPRLFL